MDILIAIFIFLILHLVWTLVLVKFPDILSKGILRKIQHKYDQDLEELRGKIRKNEITMKSSVDYITSQSEFRSKMIESVEALWNSICDCQEYFSGAMAAHRLLLPAELDTYFNKSKESESIDMWLLKYKDMDFINKSKEITEQRKLGVEILFVSSRLWLLYDTIIRVHLRYGWLLYRSYEKNEYMNWRDDDFMCSIFEGILSSEKMEEARNLKVGGLNEVLRYVTSEFISEASGLMRGSKVLEHSIPVIQAILKNQNDVK